MLEILSSVTSFIRVKRFQYAEEYTTKDFNTQKSTQQKWSGSKGVLEEGGGK